MTAQSVAALSVSFIIFTYNQELFVREAVQSALAQDFAAMDIVLSDDGSTDETFRILKDIADAYEGPHQVRAVQTEQNLGVAAHVLLRCSESPSDIVVVAAGDDVSMPDRVTCTVEAFAADKNLLAVWSQVAIMDEAGNIIRNVAERPINERRPEIFSLRENTQCDVVQGCSAAYRACLFDTTLPEGRKSYPEDLLLSFLTHAKCGGMSQIERVLVKYRQHSNAVSNRPFMLKLKAACTGEDVEHAVSDLAMFEDFQHIVRAEKAEAWIDQIALSHAKAFASSRIMWANTSFSRRLVSLLESIFARRWLEARWVMLRLFGSPGRYPALILLHWILSRTQAFWTCRGLKPLL